MEVKKLQAKIQEFKAFLKKDRHLNEVHKWEALSHFQEHWDIDTVDFGKMYKDSLQNTTTQRMWKREVWRPKEMMSLLIDQDPIFARRIFRNLFDEDKSIETRISMFKFGCEEMLQEFKRKNTTSIENNHYHDDNEMILLYLTFRYPTEYTLFEYPPFIETLKKMGIADLPDPYNLERFFKLTKILYTFLKRDEELLDIQRKRLSAGRFYKEDSKLIVHDFYRFCGQG